MATSTQRPNILMIIVDQMRFPRFGYGDEHGFHRSLKEIFGFRGNPQDDNPYRQYFPGLWALCNNAAVFRNHRTAAAACVASRAAIFSGQYGTVTGITQTDGVFKDGAHPAFPWLDPHRVPTIGDWMQTAGYTCHYFGKWHISGEATKSLQEYGFMDWEQSYPDPHGSMRNNLGYYRDYQFRDIVTSFIRRQGLGMPYTIDHAAHNAARADTSIPPLGDSTAASAPWFAVASFTNPHDIGTYPLNPRFVHNGLVSGAPYALSVPPQGSKGTPPIGGTQAIALNRLGFPQDNANLPPTWNESLDNKPTCQLENVYKMGLALASMAGWIMAMRDPNLDSKRAKLERAVKIALSTNMLGTPPALTPNPALACRAFMQYYGYLMHEVDQHIDAVLRALHESGQADNTIVLFTSDHGEYGGAHHMMTQKFHTAYDESIHVPMLIRFPASLHQVPGGLQQIDALSSHVDILPTVLGLAGIRGPALRETRDILLRTHADAHMPVGADLSPSILDADGIVRDPVTDTERKGVLFMTHDMITSPFDDHANATSDMEDESQPLSKYDVFLQVIETVRAGGDRFPEEVAKLTPGPIAQPCLVHSVVTKDLWKLVRYFAPKAAEDIPAEDIPAKNIPAKNIPNQYELYDLNTDPNEQYNLLVFDGAFPTPVDLATLPEAQQHPGVDIAARAIAAMVLLKTLEQQHLTKAEPPQPRALPANFHHSSPHPSTH